MLHISVSIASGFVLAFPYILFEVWKFIRPALTVREKSAVRGIIFYASALFFTGLLFGYFIITPLAFSFFGNYIVSESLQNLFSIQSYFSILLKTCIATGIAFELPLIIYFLSRAGIATPAWMKKYRRHAIVILVIFAALITPADPFSMIIVAIPLLLLYEFSVLISKKSQTKRS
jgi:sec-independent protein translocase protein TatC